jgi:plastocyanin
VPAGSTITWVNEGAVQHSATADDGSFDTGLLDPGAQAAVTLNTPGSYPYYCTLHGAAGGTGMAATISVVAGGGAAGVPPVEADDEGQAAIVQMLDFEFNPVALTVPAGSTITWLNQGAAQHSATASDGSFDTGLLAAGASADLAFDVPGTYAYYCTLHGTANGGGMAGTITITSRDD